MGANGNWPRASAVGLHQPDEDGNMLGWLVYAGFMVWAIFSIASVYFNALG